MTNTEATSNAPVAQAVAGNAINVVKALHCEFQGDPNFRYAHLSGYGECKQDVIAALAALAATQPAAVPDDQAGFEAWATGHGGLPLDAAGDAISTDDGLHFPTYKFGRTEIAWRAWANKPAAALVASVAQPVPATEPPEGFLSYVRANYQGVIDIHSPDWHAKRLWAAAMKHAALSAAPVAQPSQAVPAGVAACAFCGSNVDHDYAYPHPRTMVTSHIGVAPAHHPLRPGQSPISAALLSACKS